MKNIVLSFFVMMTLFAILFIFASCGNSGVENPADNQNETEVTLVSSAFYSSEFVSLPNKTEYLLNETFDATGLELKFVYEDTYSDQTTKLRTFNITYPDENLEFTVPDFSTLGEKWISVVYNDGDYFPDFSFTVWVKENISSSDPVDPDPENPTVMYTSLDSISIKNLPIKTIYSLNESFDPTGLEITATYTETYSDWTTQSKNVDITYPNNMISLSEVDMTTEGTKTITLTFTENGSSLTCTFQITVKAAAFSSIINYTTFDSEINSDLSIYNGKAMTLYLATTSVNIATLFTQFETLYDAVGENGSVSISYADAGKTTIEGELYMNDHLNMNAVNENRYANIKSFVNAIKSSVLNSDSYPTMNMQMPSRTMSDATPFNLYHTDIADLLNLYFNNYMGDKISSFSVSSSAEFDALDYLNANGGIAYDANGDYTGNYYNLNVNAALLMNGTALKNVNVTGELKDDFVVTSTVTNTRFNFSNPNSNKFEFAENVAGIGLIEFAGDAPSILPNTIKAKVIISDNGNEGHEDISIRLYGGAVIDFSKLSSLDTGNSYSFGCGVNAGVYYEYTYFKNANAYNNFKNKGGAVTGAVYYTENGTSSIPNYKTNQQWVNAANANNGEGDFVKGNGGVYFPSDAISKLNLDEKNNTLLNTILLNNQKVYNS